MEKIDSYGDDQLWGMPAEKKPYDLQKERPLCPAIIKGGTIQSYLTEAAISGHRFEIPLSPDDEFREIPIEEASLDVGELIGQAQSSAKQRAKFACKKYSIQDKDNPEETANALANRILGLLVMSRYRRGPVQFVHDGQAEILSKMESAIAEGRPIELILSFFGYKVQNPLKTWANDGTEVDISEMASLLRFYEMTEGIRELYAPGAVFHIACDGRKYADAIGFSPEQGTGYYRNISTMCKTMGIEHAVHVFEEADHYPRDINDRIAEHLESVTEQYTSGNVAMVQFVTKLQAAMSLSSPVHTSQMSLRDLRLAFSSKKDDELKQCEPEAWQVREFLSLQSLDSSLKYVAAYNAVKEAGVITSIAPEAVRATVHPKSGQLGLYAINEHSTGIFPHHGQGLMKATITAPVLEKIRMGFRADLERQKERAVGFTLPPAIFPFSNGKHPFVITNESL